MNLCDVSPAGDNGLRGGVLLVDDENALLEIYTAVLHPHFSVETAANAAEADRWLRTKRFKVIVADHMMPGETGLELLVRARVAHPHMQRVMVTGYMTPEMLECATEASLLFAFLIKPISILELLNVVQSAAQVHDTSYSATQ